MNRIAVLKVYLWFLGTFTLAWWPLSHWFYPDWYHHLMGFQQYDYSLVKIIGTTGFIPVLGLFFTAANPIRNKDFVITLLIFFVLLAGTYVYLINTRGFPVREYINVALLLVNTIVLGAIYPWRTQPNKAPQATRKSTAPEF
jgi:hypothetical protein